MKIANCYHQFKVKGQQEKHMKRCNLRNPHEKVYQTPAYFTIQLQMIVTYYGIDLMDLDV